MPYFCSEYAFPAFPSCLAVFLSDRNSCSLCKSLHLVIHLSSPLHKVDSPSQVFYWCVFQGFVLACNSSLICSPFFNILLEQWLQEQDTAFKQRTACVSTEEIFSPLPFTSLLPKHVKIRWVPLTSYFCLKIADLLEQLAQCWRGLLKYLKACGQSYSSVGARTTD